MITKRFLIMTAALVLAHLSLASTSFAQARLNELSSRLMTEANQFADASYRPSAGRLPRKSQRPGGNAGASF